eukprot:3776245-Alexandrium_andersonii.AAC.1
MLMKHFRVADTRFLDPSRGPNCAVVRAVREPDECALPGSPDGLGAHDCYRALVKKQTLLCELD